MPAFASGNMLSSSSTDVILSKSLDKILNNSSGTILDSNLKSAHHTSLLNCSLKFRVGEQTGNLTLSNLSERYNKLQNGCDSSKLKNLKENGEKISQKEPTDDGIPIPKITISDVKDIKLTWQQIFSIGSGLKNLGNSCFMNAVLQCLTYLPPVYNALVEKHHTGSCLIKGFCSLCEVQKHVVRALKCTGATISPTFFFNNLHKIGQFVKFKQEDAHEFLRFLLSHMEKCALDNFKYKHSIRVDAASSRTTVVNNIFGGFSRSQVVCLKCRETSSTFDPFMDIMLDIKHAETIDSALEKYIKTEKLDGDNAYQCQHCKCRVPAQKKVALHRLPAVCTFHLKRFNFHNAFGSKICKWVRFPEKLNMRPYMSNPKGPPVFYILRGIVVHSGYNLQSGHYYAYVRNSRGNFYCMNDDSVSQIDKSKVFSQNAYILFYSKIPQVQKQSDNAKINKSSGMNHSAIKPNMLSHSKTQDNTQKPITSVTSKPAVPAETSDANKADEDNTSKPPRIVLKIKSKRVNGFENKTPSKGGLVPYVGDSENDSDSEKNGIGASVSKSKELFNGHSISSEVVNKSPEKAPKNCVDSENVQNCVGAPLKITDNKILMSPSCLNTAVPTVPLFKKVRRLSGSLISRTTSPSLINASSNWSVTENKNPEPSVASSSSSATSMNSTFDNWTVTGHEIDSPNVDRRSCLGWKVQKSPCSRDKKANCLESKNSAVLNHDKRSESEKDINLLTAERTKGENDLCLNPDKNSVKPVKCFKDSTVDMNHKRIPSENNLENIFSVSSAAKKNTIEQDPGSDSDSSSSSYEVEWVEKTKETIEKACQKNIPDGNRDVKSQNDPYHSDKRYCNGGSSKGDHRFEDKKYFKQLKDCSLQGYGSSVKSWNGNASELNVQVEQEKRFKRWATDDYDDSYDRGSTKKIKYNHSHERRHKFAKSFQEVYNEQKYDKYFGHRHDSRNDFRRDRYDNYKDNRHHRQHDRHSSYHGKSNSHHSGRKNDFRRNSFHSGNPRWEKRR